MYTSLHFSAPGDYTSGGYSVTFAANAAAGTVECTNIPIIDDNLVENAEGFGLSTSTTDGRVSFLSETSTSVFIADNDGKLHQAFVIVLCVH